MPDVSSSERMASTLDRLISWSTPSESTYHTRSSPQANADDAAASATEEPEYTCARRLDQVQMAWSLVYERYTGKGLIDENPFRVHTAPQAVGRHACVVYGLSGHAFRSTMTLIGDNEEGVPLDSVYGERLNDLRRQGRSLVEVGLLADHCRGVRRGARALFDMMRWAAYYTLHTYATDIVIGVHPRHVRFYMRCFGFDRFAPPALYPLVKDNPVVPLRLPLREALAEETLPRGLAYVRDNPIPAGEFSQRFEFEPEKLRGSIIESFLENRYGINFQSEADSTTDKRESPTVASLLEDILPTLPGSLRRA